MNFNLNKKIKSVVGVYGIIAFIYIFAFLIIPFDKTAASWISFVFTILSFGASFAIGMYAFSGEKSLKSKFYGLPIFRIAYLYPIAQLILGIIICAICAFAEVPAWIALLLSVILMGLAAIGVIATDNTRDIIQEIDTQTEESIKTNKYFRLNISAITALCTDVNAKEVLRKLEEDFRYSDPVSSEHTEAIENNIAGKLYELRSVISTASSEEIISRAAEIKNMLAERNRICKAFK